MKATAHVHVGEGNTGIGGEVAVVSDVHDRRPALLVDAEALRVKRTLAADLATNELAAR